MYDKNNMIKTFPELFTKCEIPEEIKIWMNLKIFEWEPGEFWFDFIDGDEVIEENSMLHEMMCQHICLEAFEITETACQEGLYFPDKYKKCALKMLEHKLMYKLNKRLFNEDKLLYLF